MVITQDESRAISVLASQGEIIKLKRTVNSLAEREGLSVAELLMEAKDDFQQTAAHMAAKAGQTRTPRGGRSIVYVRKTGLIGD